MLKTSPVGLVVIGSALSLLMFEGATRWAFLPAFLLVAVIEYLVIVQYVLPNLES